MNILYINHYAGSPEMGMEFRPYYFSREWIKMGHNVRIIAGDYSHLRIKNPKVENDFQEEIIDGITYNWVKTGTYDGNGIARALTMFRFVHKLKKKANWIANTWKPDVIITSSTYPLDTYAGQKIKKYTKKMGIKKGRGATLIHEVHDMWPSTLYEVGGMSKRNPFVVLMQIAENSAYRHCDKCIALLSYSKEYMIKHGLNPNKFINIQNGIVEEEWNNPETIPHIHNEFFANHSNKFIVGYFGGHALSNALDKSLDVAKEFVKKGDEQTIFVFVGDGVEKSKLVERAKKENINNAFFLPQIKKKAIPDLLRYFDCSYITGMTSPLYRFGLCLNKMYDSMMAGLPIICAFDAPDTLVKKYECGFQCNPADVNEVVKSITELEEMTPEMRKKMGQNGKEAILSNFTYKKLAKTFLDNVLIMENHQ